MDNTEQELFEEFTYTVVSNRIIKNWTVTYKGKEVKGTYTYEHDDWGLQDSNYEIDADYAKDLTDEEYEEVLDYVAENI